MRVCVRFGRGRPHSRRAAGRTGLVCGSLSPGADAVGTQPCRSSPLMEVVEFQFSPWHLPLTLQLMFSPLASLSFTGSLLVCSSPALPRVRKPRWCCEHRMQTVETVSSSDPDRSGPLTFLFPNSPLHTHTPTHISTYVHTHVNIYTHTETHSHTNTIHTSMHVCIHT